MIGGQDQFYLEGQIALAIPGEADEMTLFTSTQHPTEVQHMVAHALDVPASASLNCTVTSLATIEVSAHSPSPILKSARLRVKPPVAVVH